MRRALKALLVALIRCYQRYLSPLFPAHCRYLPTCSEYMLTAIQHHGAGRGLWLGLKRIGRCHPLGGSGYDPVPEAKDRQLTSDCTDSHSSSLGNDKINGNSNNG